MIRLQGDVTSERNEIFKTNRRASFLKKGGRTLVALCPLLAALAAAAQVIENPATPPSANAGRVMELREVARITEEEGKFFFEQPWDVHTGPDGSVYVQEMKKLLKFDAQGRFVKNLLKWGEGPGELNGNLTDVVIGRDEILLYSSNAYKVLRLDFDGRLLGEKKFTAGLSALWGYRKGRYVGMKSERKDRPPGTGFFTDDYRLTYIADNGETTTTSCLLPLTYSQHIRTLAGRPAAGRSSISRFMPCRADDQLLFLFHSPEYLIELVDLEKGELVRSFRRAYERVKYEYRRPKNLPDDYPIPKFHNDLCRLLWVKDRLWAVTSTVDKTKGILVDVFSREGQYLDNFYLPLLKIRRNNPQYYAPMAIAGNVLYLLEADEDDLISLIKYEIVGN